MRKKVLAVSLFLGVFALSGAAVVSATTVTDIMGDYPGIMYGDFQAWSLPVLDELAQANYDGLDDTMYFRTATSPGQIHDDVVLYSFPASAIDNTDTLGTGGDDSFRTSKQLYGSYSTNEASGDPDPNGTGEWDTGDAGGYTWDVDVAALNTWLAGDAPIFYFNNNQVGSGLTENSLYMWGQVSLTDYGADGHYGGGDDTEVFFYFNNPYNTPAGYSGDESLNVPEANNWTPPAYDTPTGSGDMYSLFDGLDSDPNYALLPGFVYVNTNTGQLSLDPATDPTPGIDPTDPGWTYVKLNLGADEAAYAAYSQDLTDALASGVYESMHVDFRLGTPIVEDYDPDLFDAGYTAYIGQLNNGYEQLLIRQSTVFTTIPEPATMFLLGTGLVGIAGAARRRKKNLA